jgi:hypothetical protein
MLAVVLKPVGYFTVVKVRLPWWLNRHPQMRIEKMVRMRMVVALVLGSLSGC